MSERTLTCPQCSISFTSRRSDGTRSHCYRCVPPTGAESKSRGTPCERCGRPSRGDRCSRCRVIVACRKCGGDAHISSSRYGDPDASAVCRKCGWAKRDPDSRPGNCAHCGDEFAQDGRYTRKYCSRECSVAAHTLRVTLRCEVCDEEFTRKPSDVKRKGGRFCSKACFARHKSAEAAKRRAENPKPPQPPQPPRSRVYFRECDVCKRMFCGRNSRAKFCSAQCKIDDAGMRVKGLYAAATEFVDGQYFGAEWRQTLLRYLVERDGDRCGICRRRVDITLKSGTRGSRRGPSVDHIIPRSKGGSDDPANLRLTHWGCNQKRGNRGGNEQLALVG